MVQYPTPEQIWDAAEEVGLSLTEDDVKSYLGLIKPNIDAYNLVDAMPDYLPHGEVSAHAGLLSRRRRRTRTMPGT